jgi:TM2 domain-containing membrane protein YozV
MKCGYTKTKYNPMLPPQGALYKNEGTGLILSIVLGLFGLNGIGQIYAGRVGRGIGIMIGSWVLIVVGVLTMGIGLIAYLAIFIWQIFDTKNLCRQYNEFVSQNGRPPW